jgi:uncharacterized protein (TIGR02266 family)
MSAGDDKRAQPRLDLILRVDYASREDFLADYASNASEGGVFIATDKDFEVGDSMFFDVSFPGLLEPIRCQGKVRWRRTEAEVSDEAHAGIGVAFEFENQEDASRIERLMQDLSVPPEGDAEAETFRVLLVEHDPETREEFQLVLQAYHHLSQGGSGFMSLDTAGSGRAAWDLLSSKKSPDKGKAAFDMAIIDLQISDMQGEELIRNIRKTWKPAELAIIAIGDGSRGSKRKSLSAGADLYLRMPVVVAKLFESLQRLVSLRSVAS